MSTNAAITAMPDPDPVVALQEENRELSAQISAQNKHIERLVKEREELQNHLRELQENPFSFALTNIDAGDALRDLGSELLNICELVQKRQEPGKLALTLTIKPFKGSSLVFSHDIKPTEPKTEPSASIFFISEDAKLTRNDPRQKELF